jgi:hypothetical protein
MYAAAPLVPTLQPVAWAAAGVKAPDAGVIAGAGRVAAPAEPNATRAAIGAQRRIGVERLTCTRGLWFGAATRVKDCRANSCLVTLCPGT